MACGYAAQINDPYTWDFGVIKDGEVARHKFIFKNETGAPLKIISVNTSCGCTTSGVEKKELKPGEETVIIASFNSKGYSGNVQQFIYAQTDNVDKPVVRFIIKAEVIK